jgi:Fe-Mn family superoxide dismutase
MEKHNRREFIKRSALAAGSLVLGGMSLKAEAADLVSSKTPQLTKRPLPFDPKKLSGLSEKLITSHWENNYGGSVKTLNEANRRLALALADAETPPFLYGDLKREQLLRTGSVILHELYFENLGGGGSIDNTLKAEIAKQFGSFESWQAEFKKIAQSLSGGSGWVILSYNTHFHKMENHGLSDHLQNPPASIPLLVLDMFEHSYQMDYGAAALKYIEAFFANINWSAVEKRFTQVKTAY